MLKVCSIEDPVEFDLDGVSQTQVAPAQGLDFPTVLRAILRQDPNMVMIGEIRDAETAAIACRAALIGRLVVSTLHVKDPSEAPIRLKDLGVEPDIIDAVFLGALGQTLRPVICDVSGGKGCAGCGGTGVTGRELYAKFVMG